MKPALSPSLAPRLSVVIPVYNEEESVGPLAAEVVAALEPAPWSFEVVLVDDGSNDGSLATMEALARRDERFRVVHCERNQGQSAALLIGFHHARGERVATLDADLQNDPADIPKLLAVLDDGPWDCISGVRANRKDDWVRKVSSRLANRVRDWVVHDGISDVGCSLKVYRAATLRQLPAFNGLHRFLPAVIKRRGARIYEMPVRHRPRKYGISKYGISNRLWRGLADLVGVRWYLKRWVDPSLGEEVTPLAAAAASTSTSTSDLPLSVNRLSAGPRV